MRRVWGQVKHDPTAGTVGDCFRAALASLLDLEARSVPHFMGDNRTPEQVFAQIRAWLTPQGLGLVLMPFRLEPGETVGKVLGLMKAINPGEVYLLQAQHPDFGEDHVVVCQGDRMLHDPDSTTRNLPPDRPPPLVRPPEDGMVWALLLTRHIRGA